MATDTISKRSATALGALAGLVAAVVALGVAELVAGLRREWKSPVLDVGDRIIDRVPLPLKTFAIETFGDKDKIALLAGIGVFLALYAMVIGALAFRRHVLIGIVGIGAFGVIGAVAALSRRVGGSFSDAVPSIVGAIVGAAALWLIHRVASPILPATAGAIATPPPPPPPPPPPSTVLRCQAPVRPQSPPRCTTSRLRQPNVPPMSRSRECEPPGVRCWCAPAG